MNLEQIQKHEFFRDPIPDMMPSSTLACPPSKEFLAKYKSYGFSISSSEFKKSNLRGPGVNMPATLAFKTKSEKQDNFRPITSPKVEVKLEPKKSERNNSKHSHRSVPRASFNKPRDSSGDVMIR